MRNDALAAQKFVRDRIAKNNWFAEHKVRVILQDEFDLAYLVNTELAKVEGVLVVLSVDFQKNLGQGATQVEMSAICTESVPLNRLDNGFASALAVAQAIGYMLDSPEIHWLDTKHEAADGGVLIATARFSLIIEPQQNTNGE